MVNNEEELHCTMHWTDLSVLWSGLGEEEEPTIVVDNYVISIVLQIFIGGVWLSTLKENFNWIIYVLQKGCSGIRSHQSLKSI